MYCQLSPKHLLGLILQWISRGGRKSIKSFIASQSIFDHSSLNNGSIRAPLNFTLTRLSFSPPKLWCQTQTRRSSRSTGQNPPTHPHPPAVTAFLGRPQHRPAPACPSVPAPPLPVPRPRRDGTGPLLRTWGTPFPYPARPPPHCPGTTGDLRAPGRRLPHRSPLRSGDTKRSRLAKGSFRFAKRPEQEGGRGRPVPRGSRCRDGAGRLPREDDVAGPRPSPPAREDARRCTLNHLAAASVLHRRPLSAIAEAAPRSALTAPTTAPGPRRARYGPRAVSGVTRSSSASRHGPCNKQAAVLEVKRFLRQVPLSPSASSHGTLTH